MESYWDVMRSRGGLDFRGWGFWVGGEGLLND